MNKKLICLVITILFSLELYSIKYYAKDYSCVEEEFVVSYYAGEANFSIYLDNYNNLYSVGSNASGQLGRGFSDQSKKIEPLTTKVLSDVSLVSTGRSGFVIAYTNDSTLYGWGINQYGQTGHKTKNSTDPTDNIISIPSVIHLDDNIKIKDIKSGERHTLLLDINGNVYAFGNNNLGQLGLGLETSRKTIVSEPTKIDELFFNYEKIVQIETSEYTSYCLTESGDLYTFGDNSDGTLGDSSEDYQKIVNVPTFTDIRNVEKISAKSTTCLYLTADNKAFVFGSNIFNQFGNLEFTGLKSSVPVEIKDLQDLEGVKSNDKIIDILAGGISNFLLTDKNDIYSFGSGGSNELGFDIFNAESVFNTPGITSPKLGIPTKINFYEPLSIKEITEKKLTEYIGKTPAILSHKIDVKIDKFINSSGSRTFIRDINGNVWSFGNNEDGQVASGNIATIVCPIISTLYRDDNYDKEIKQKNYLIGPIIGISLIFGTGLAFIIYAEIKRYSNK
ncbi:MAG: hypothetical protein LBV58_03905 [Acholeplasmatales bacterium]|jgi:alpha-tubulin suppressor-like RCC1 family protein|nr:hypothetical protein [Acholeplasmatales bacterium]